MHDAWRIGCLILAAATQAAWGASAARLRA